MYDLAIIGAGAAGIAAAKRGLKYKLKTALIDKDQSLVGGTCLNKGCIPTKFFLNQVKTNKTWQDTFALKEKTILSIREPLLKYLEKEGISFFAGQAQFIDSHKIKVNDNIIEAKNIIIATGSSPKMILSGPNIIPAEDLFKLASLPENILIVGGGYIGIEIASLLNAFKKEVTVVESQDLILSLFDRSISQRLQVSLTKKGINILTSADVRTKDLKDFDLVLLSVGRDPNIKDLNYENINLLVDEKGWIKTDSFCRTNLANIYACGDITGKNLLAYVAQYQANVCVDNIAGIVREKDYTPIPECVFSLPQVAKVGATEKELQEKNISFKVIQSSFMRFSSAYVYDDKDGYIKIFVDNKGNILGASILSNYAGELINTIALAMKNNITSDKLKDLMFIHPTISEIIPLVLS